MYRRSRRLNVGYGKDDKYFSRGLEKVGFCDTLFVDREVL